VPLPTAITRAHVVKALEWIDANPHGVPVKQRIRKFALRYLKRDYPPKFVVRKAYEFFAGTEFKEIFNGGTQTNNFLIRRNFEIWNVIATPPSRVGLTIVAEESEEVFREGRVLTQYRLHRKIERSGRVAKFAKQRALDNDATLPCEACGFSFVTTYGDLGTAYIEAHHKVPLSDLKERVTLLKDIALLCANCHRMVHQQNPLITVEELKLLLPIRAVLALTSSDRQVV
jgi:hypothetical protein